MKMRGSGIFVGVNLAGIFYRYDLDYLKEQEL